MTDTPADAPGRIGPPSTAYDPPKFGDWRDTSGASPDGGGGAETLPPTKGGRKGGGGPLGRFGGPLRWVAGIFGAIVLLIVIFLWLFQWDWLRGPISRFASAQAHREIHINGHLRVHLLTWTPTVRVEGITVGQPDWGAKAGLKGNMVEVASVTASVKLLGLLRGHIDVPLFDIEKPNLVLFQDAQGKANWDFSDPNKKTTGKPLKLPPIEKFVIADGRINAMLMQRKLKFTGMINSTERASSSNAQTFKVSGDGMLNNKPFHMLIAGGPLINIHRDQPYPFSAELSAGDTRLSAKGNVPHPFDLGHLDMTLGLQGKDLNDLYYLTNLGLPDSPPYSISGHLTRDEKIFHFNGAKGRVGGSDIEGDLTVDTTNKRPYMKGALQSRLLDFKDLASLFGAPGASRAATSAQKAQTAATTAGDTRLLPDATLNVTQIKAADADVTFKAQAVNAPGLPLKSVEVGVHLKDGDLHLNPIRISFPQGSLNGSVGLDGRPKDPITDVDLRLSNVQMDNFIPTAKGAPKPLEGTLVARAKLHAVGNSVHRAAASSNGQVVAYIPGGHIRRAFAELIGVDASAGLTELLGKNQQESELRCAVADFKVQNGVLQAQNLAIDTTVTVVKGQGSINLNDETLNLQFKGSPTGFRLIHLSAPITIGGHLKKPTFGIKPTGAAAQVGIAVVAAAAVNPLLAIVPFLDLGGKKNIDCGAAAAEATQGPASVAPALKKTPARGPGKVVRHAH